MLKLEKLDEVLNYINTKTVWSELRLKFKDIDREDLRIIIRKFRKDGFVDLLNAGIQLRAWDDEKGYNDDMVIQKNFEGFLFCQENGYVGKAAKEKNQNSRLQNLETTQLNLARKLNILTMWVAIGSVGLVIVEVAKFIYEISK